MGPEESCRGAGEGLTGRCGQHNPEPLRCNEGQEVSCGDLAQASSTEGLGQKLRTGGEMAGEPLLRLVSHSQGRYSLTGQVAAGPVCVSVSV